MVIAVSYKQVFSYSGWLFLFMWIGKLNPLTGEKQTSNELKNSINKYEIEIGWKHLYLFIIPVVVKSDMLLLFHYPVFYLQHDVLM